MIMMAYLDGDYAVDMLCLRGWTLVLFSLPSPLAMNNRFEDGDARKNIPRTHLSASLPSIVAETQSRLGTRCFLLWSPAVTSSNGIPSAPAPAATSTSTAAAAASARNKDEVGDEKHAPGSVENMEGLSVEGGGDDGQHTPLPAFLSLLSTGNDDAGGDGDGAGAAVADAGGSGGGGVSENGGQGTGAGTVDKLSERFAQLATLEGRAERRRAAAAAAAAMVASSSAGAAPGSSGRYNYNVKGVLYLLTDCLVTHCGAILFSCLI